VIEGLIAGVGIAEQCNPDADLGVRDVSHGSGNRRFDVTADVVAKLVGPVVTGLRIPMDSAPFGASIAGGEPLGVVWADRGPDAATRPIATNRKPQGLARRRGLASFSRVGSLKIKHLAEKVFTTELGFFGSEVGICLRNLKQEAIRRQFAKSLRTRKAFRNRVGLHYTAVFG
jgi:hypothetical protein